jgi:crossover junction endodeoxyribonuclease RusA
VIELDLPWPPSGNNLFPTRGGRRTMSTEGRVYRARVVGLVWKAFGRRPDPLAVPLSVEVLAHQPDKRRRDLSNLWKALEDSLTAAGIWTDDSLVVDQRMAWSSVPAIGTVRVRIRPAPEVSP